MQDDEPYMRSGSFLNGERSAKVRADNSGFFYIKVYALSQEITSEMITFIIEVKNKQFALFEDKSNSWYEPSE